MLLLRGAGRDPNIEQCGGGERCRLPSIRDPTLAALAPKLERLASRMPGIVAISIADLSGGHALAINGNVNLPAASTIKVPVMVEVFRQIAQGRLTQSTRVALTDGDRDCGYGSLCDAPWGTRYTVGTLLQFMIERSDNTAANMLIRTRRADRTWNATMAGLGLVRQDTSRRTASARTATSANCARARTK